MKIKFFKILISVLFLLPCVFFMTACGVDPDASAGNGGDSGAGDGGTSVQADIFEYESLWDNYISITGLKDDSVKNIIIPAEYNGKIVERISYEAFKGEAIESVTISAGVMMVDSNAFSDCKSLKSVTIADGVSLAGEVFSGCTALEDIVLPEGLNEVPYGIFNGCSSLESIDLPNSVCNISDYAFFGCENLINVAIPENANFSYVGVGAFDGCNKLQVQKVNGNLNCLNLGNCSVLLSVDEGSTEVELSESVDVVAAGCFSNCQIVEDLTIGIELSNIYEVFSYMPNLDNLKILNSYNLFSLPYDSLSSLEVVGNGRMMPIGNHFLIDTLIIGDGITSFDISFWDNLQNVNNLVIGKGVTEFTSYYFDSVNDLSFNSIKYNGTVEEWAMNSFETINCNLMNYTTDFEFVGESNQENIVFDNNIEKINQYAFVNNSKIKNIKFAENVSIGSIEVDAFVNCPNIVKLEVLSDDCNFKGRTGTLMGGGATSFFNNNTLKEFVGPANVIALILNQSKLESAKITSGERLLGMAFNAPKLSYLELCDGLKRIESSAFLNCSSLLELYIPKSVIFIAPSAFQFLGGEPVLEVVKYEGSAVDWAQISMSENDFVPGIGSILYGAKLYVECGVNSIIDANSNYVTSVKLENIDVASGAYSAYDYLENIEIVTRGTNTIGKYAFSSISGASIKIDGFLNIPDGFAYDSNLVKLEICDSTISLGENICANGTITELLISKNIQTFSANAFYSVRPTKLKLPVNMIYENDYLWYFVVDCYEVEELILQGGGESCKQRIYSFNNNTNIKMVKVLDGVESLSSYLFSNSSIVSCDMSEAVDLVRVDDGIFLSCNNLTSVNFPNCLEIIGESVFRYASKIESVVIPSSVVQLGERCFEHAAGLKSVDINGNIDVLGLYMFQDCTSLESVTLPDSIEEIKDFAFGACVALTEIELPESLKNIGWSAFYSCKSLTEIELPSGVQQIGREAFYNTKICAVNLPSSVISIGTMFIGNEKIQLDYSFNFAGTIQQWLSVDLSGESANPGYHGEFTIGGEPVVEIIIPSDIVEIKPYVIAYFNNLESVSSAGKLQAVGNLSFGECPNLVSLILKFEEEVEYGEEILRDSTLSSFAGSAEMCDFIPNETIESINITSGSSIAPESLFGATSLVSVEISDSVVNYGTLAFDGCSAIESVNIHTTIAKWLQKSFGLRSFPVTKTGGILFEGQTVENLNITVNVPDYCFYNIATIKNVKVSGDVRVGTYAFGKNIGLISVDLDVSSFGNFVFEDCDNIETVTLSNRTSNLSNVFSGFYFNNEKLEMVTYNGSVNEWCQLSWGGIGNTILGDARLIIDGKLVEDVVVSSSVEKVADCAFYAYRYLKSLVFENGVSEIGYAAFYYSTVENVTFPASLNIIGEDAFGNCDNLQELLFNSNLILDEGSFRYCDNLKRVEFMYGAELKEGAFEDTTIDYIILTSGSIIFYEKSMGMVLYLCLMDDVYVISRCSASSEYDDSIYAKKYFYSTEQTSGKYWKYDVDGKTILIAE